MSTNLISINVEALLTLKAVNKICSRQHFQIFRCLYKKPNKAWRFYVNHLLADDSQSRRFTQTLQALFSSKKKMPQHLSSAADVNNITRTEHQIYKPKQIIMSEDENLIAKENQRPLYGNSLPFLSHFSLS